MGENDNQIRGRYVLKHDDDIDGRSLKSLVTSEQMRLVHQEGIASKEAYWQACKAVGEMCVPPLSPEKVNELSTGYTSAAGQKTRALRRKSIARPREDGGLGDGWFEVEEPVRNKMQELEEYLGLMKPGDSRMKRGLTKEEAKGWQTAVSAWARKPQHRREWYNQDSTPRFATSTVPMGDDEYALVVTKVR